jgi:hypothetical protein
MSTKAVGPKAPTFNEHKAAGPKAPNFNEYAMDSTFQQLRQHREQLIQLIIMDNFLRLHNLDRHLQLYNIKQHQTININILNIAST